MQGARFYRSDLHVHTPGSKDFNDKTDAATFVKTALAAGLEIIAVTDHNATSTIAEIRSEGKKQGLVVLPGVEITTPEGHILAIFEHSFDPAKIGDFLVRIGIPREEHGKESAISTTHAEEVIREIAGLGGLAIAAHANEKSSGLLQTKGQYKVKTVPMPALTALELSKEDEIAKFCSGKVSADYAPKACVQGSDSHALSEMGRRPTFFKMQSPSLNGIRQALFDYRLKVRFPWNLKTAAYPRILSLSVNQGFFAGQTFEFHDNLNCLIGGKGTGKSTVVELLRFAFADVSDFENIRDDHNGKIQRLLGDGGTVTAKYLDGDGVTKIISREFQPWGDQPREVRDEHGNHAAIDVPPAFFSQGEIVQVASNPLAQMDLIDRHLDLSKENRAEQEILHALDGNAEKIVAGDDRIAYLEAELADTEKGKAVTEQRFKTLEAQLQDPVLKTFPAWEAEQKLLQELQEAVGNLKEEAENSLSELSFEHLDLNVPIDSPNAAALQRLTDVRMRAEAAAKHAGELFNTEIAAIDDAIKKVASSLAPTFDAQKVKHDGVLDTIGESDARKATAQFRSVGKRREQLRQHEGELTGLARARSEAEKERQKLLAQLGETRKQRWQKRFEKVSLYQGKLAGLVRINIVANGDRTKFFAKLRELAKGGYVEESDLRKIASMMTPDDLAARIKANDSGRIAKAANVTMKVAERVVKNVAEKGFREICSLECVDLPDRPEVSYIFSQGKEKLLKELSTGQKGTVIIALAMIEGSGPLVIDQPEEPLDTESVYGQVVQTLRDNKEQRQFIFTTHNPNVAVGADADLSHVLQAGADSGSIQSSGAIDDIKTNKLLLLHLEGGRVALEMRVGKYHREED